MSHDIPLACGTNTKVIKKASFESTYRTEKVQNSCSKCGVTQTAKIPYADAECNIEGTLGWCGVFYNGKTRNAHIEVMQILVICIVDKYSDFMSAVGLGNTLLWRFSFLKIV